MTECQTTRTLAIEYSAPVRDCRRELRVLAPLLRAGQQQVAQNWNCQPPPDQHAESIDEFGNRVLTLHHARIERVVEFEMTLQTRHDATVRIERSANLPPSGIGAFLLPSELCDWTPELQQTAEELADATAAEICHFVFQHLEYLNGQSTAQTKASQSLSRRRGVCQDFAHLMISLCRALKLPTRYISGYLPGEGAMHAWCEVLQHDEWLALDPTHDRPVREDYVVVGCGRDFRDVAPTVAAYRGRARAQLRSFCKTTILA